MWLRSQGSRGRRERVTWGRVRGGPTGPSPERPAAANSGALTAAFPTRPSAWRAVRAFSATCPLPTTLTTHSPPSETKQACVNTASLHFPPPELPQPLRAPAQLALDDPLVALLDRLLSGLRALQVPPPGPPVALPANLLPPLTWRNDEAGGRCSGEEGAHARAAGVEPGDCERVWRASSGEWRGASGKWRSRERGAGGGQTGRKWETSAREGMGASRCSGNGSWRERGAGRAYRGEPWSPASGPGARRGTRSEGCACPSSRACPRAGSGHICVQQERQTRCESETSQQLLAARCPGQAKPPLASGAAGP